MSRPVATPMPALGHWPAAHAACSCSRRVAPPDQRLRQGGPREREGSRLGRAAGRRGWAAPSEASRVGRNGDMTPGEPVLMDRGSRGHLAAGAGDASHSREGKSVDGPGAALNMPR